MRIQNRHNVVKTIAIHVIYCHHAAAHDVSAVARERLRMVCPGSLTARWRLLPPSVGIRNVRTSVTVNVANAKSMPRCEPSLGNIVNDPGFSGLPRDRFRVAHET